MSYSRAELEKMNEMASELAGALKKRPMPDFPPENTREARAAHLRGLRHLMPVPGPIPEQVEEREHLIQARDGYAIRTLSYRPKDPGARGGPLIVLYHEGGWCAGDLTDEEFNARLLTRDLGATCLNVEYRLAPEHPFPTSINDSWDALRWAAAHATADLDADPATQGFVVGGSSAGGNLSAILAHLSRETDLQPPVTGQWLSVPYLIPSTRCPPQYQEQFISMAESHHDPVLHDIDDASPQSPFQALIKYDLDSPLFSTVAPSRYPPASADPCDGRPLARAYLQAAGLDPLRDQAVVYSRILQEEYGVPARLDLYPGYGHMFWTNWPEMDESRKFAQDMLDGFRWLLGRS